MSVSESNEHVEQGRRFGFYSKVKLNNQRALLNLDNGRKVVLISETPFATLVNNCATPSGTSQG